MNCMVHERIGKSKKMKGLGFAQALFFPLLEENGWPHGVMLNRFFDF